MFLGQLILLFLFSTKPQFHAIIVNANNTTIITLEIMSGRISVSDEELQNIINSLDEAAATYTTNLNKITGVIDQTTSGSIKRRCR